jgi:carboxypeptidase Taq
MKSASYAALEEKIKRAGLLASVQSLLGWDEQVNLPLQSSARRASQSALLAELRHDLASDPEIGNLLEELRNGTAALSDDQRVVVRHVGREYDRVVRLPREFVSRKAIVDSEAYHVWRRARETSDFGKFAPYLQQQVDMCRQEASFVGWGERPYDYMIDRHDHGMDQIAIRALFDELRTDLVPLVHEIIASPIKARTDLLKGFPVEAQEAFLREVTAVLGFDYGRGRIDVAVHPFCSGDAADTRMTTRFHEDDPLDSLFSSIHETGHGLYEQGLPIDALGTPLGEAVGMAIHESQSRLWENQVCRSRSFWSFFGPKFRSAFPGKMDSVSDDELYLAINAVRLYPIRVDSDEVTYNLHILLRFELERALFSGELLVNDLPREWNRLSRELLGIEPENDAAGVLQDVHWSGGAFGYFPSYCLGNMIAAQLWSSAQQALPGLEVDFSRGEFGRLLAWLRENIHRHGRRFDTRELIRKVTGEEISPRHLVRYLRERYRPLYFPAVC